MAEEVRAKGRRAISVTCDVTDLDSVRALAETTKAELGAYHVVCNNAGVISGGPTTEMSAAEWDWVLDVDLQGVVNGVIAFLPGLVEQGEGHIVNTASIAGLVPMAARVVEGVKANDLYIVTHPETREAVEERFAAIMAAFDKLEASLG